MRMDTVSLRGQFIL